MNLNIEVDIDGLMSRKACAIIIKHIIKFIAYNNNQIPYTYEGLQELVSRRRQDSEKIHSTSQRHPLSFKQIKANNFYDKIESIYDTFETTFKCLEEELAEGNSFKEIAIVLGATVVSPKHVCRIRIPKLSSYEDSDKRIRSHLFRIYRRIISSNGANQCFGKDTGLTNIFILINGECKSALGKEWFVPKFDFRITQRVSQTTISFIDPSVEKECISEDVANDQRIALRPSSGNNSVLDNQINKNPSIGKWYLAKQALTGFQDLKIDGISIFNERICKNS